MGDAVSDFSDLDKCGGSQARVIFAAYPVGGLRTQTTLESYFSSVLLNPKFAMDDAANEANFGFRTLAQ